MKVNHYYIHGVFFFLVSLFASREALCSTPPEAKWTSVDSLAIQNLLDLSWTYKISNIDWAVHTAKEAISLSRNLDFQEGEANGLHALGIIKWYQYDLPGALNYFLEALGIREEINDELGLGRSYNNIGNVYFEVNDYERALVCYEKSLELRESLQDTLGLIFSFSNIGDIYLEQEKREEALSFYRKSEKLAIVSGDISKLSYIKGKLGDFAEKSGFLKEAQEYWKESLLLAEKSQNKRQLAISLNKIIELALQTKDIDFTKFKEQAFRALSLAKEIKNINLQGEAILHLVAIASANRDYKEAFEYKQEYQQLMSPFWAHQQGNIINEVRANFENRKKNEELRQNEESLSLKLNLLWLILISFFLSVIGYWYFNSKKRYAKQVEVNAAISKKRDDIANKNTELSQTNEVLARFAFAASHDLKEPLRNIGAFTDLLQRRNGKTLTDESKEYIRFILDATYQMRQVLDDLLEFEKLTHPPSKSMKMVNMTLLFSDWISQNQLILNNQKVTIQLSPLPVIKAYPQLIVDLINHLLNNATKFHEKDIPIVVKIGYYSTNRQHVFSIEDNGIGIDPTYKNKIFETFQRLDKYNFKGTGMGLALCKRIISHHNGQIWVESEEGQGSRFLFSLIHQDGDIAAKDIAVSVFEHNSPQLSTVTVD